MMRIFKGLLLLVASTLVVSCGGGSGAGTSPFGSGSSGGTGGGATGPVAASVQVISNSPQIGTAGDTTQVTAIVRDSSNVVIPAAAVTFAADTGSLSGVKLVADASGVATATFSAGADKTNRTATVTVKSGTVSGTLTIAIAGTKISVAGPTTLQFNGISAVSVKLIDSGGSPISGQAVAVSSSLGASLSTASITTDASGTASVTYTANKAGSDSVQFSALGATATLPVKVSGADFSIISPAAATTVPISTAQPVTARYLISGVPATGAYSVRFASTAGTVAPSAAVPLVSGQAAASVTSSFAGPATVQATLVDSAGAVLAQATLSLQFVATTPTKVVLQISPTAIGPNAAGSTTNQANIIATVSDSVGNPVQGAIVNFSKDADPSGGNLSQASAPTNSNGQVTTVQFIAGATPTAAGAVVLRATVVPPSGASFFSTASMTVNQSALFIGLGTGNKITVVPSSNSTQYQKVWTAYVTDSSGAAVANQSLSVSVLPVAYRKGSYAFDGKAWTYSVIPDSGSAAPTTDLPAGFAITCANEDTDYSGIVTVAKDYNGNGRLEPGNVISVNGGGGTVTLTTDATGFALLNLVYAESYAFWVEVTLKVTATVAGTESSNQATFWAPGLVDDYSNASVSPPGNPSPFGQRSSCKDAN